MLLAISFLFLSCARKGKPVDYIARVDDEYLTESDLKGVDTAIVESYVRNWVNNNLLYLEAKERGYGSDPEIDREVEEFRKSLVVRKFLEKEVYGKKFNFSEDEMKKYYEKHKGEFILDEPVLRMGYVRLNSRRSADKLRRVIRRTGSFSRGVKEFIASNNSSVIEIVKSKYFYRHTTPTPEIWDVADKMEKGEVSFPIKVGYDYYILYLYEKKSKGDTADFELVKDEVRARMRVEKQNKMLDSLIAKLKRKYIYEIR